MEARNTRDGQVLSLRRIQSRSPCLLELRLLQRQRDHQKGRSVKLQYAVEVARTDATLRFLPCRYPWVNA